MEQTKTRWVRIGEAARITGRKRRYIKFLIEAKIIRSRQDDKNCWREVDLNELQDRFSNGH